MPAVSSAQQRLFGAVLAYKRGKMKGASSKIKQIASGISEGDAADFARKKEGRKRLAENMSR